jgi:rhodanese-related sulfurtransferase
MGLLLLIMLSVHSHKVGMSRKHKKPNRTIAKQDSHRQKKTQKQNLPWLWVGLGLAVVVIVGVLWFTSGTGHLSKSSPSPTAASVEISATQAYAKYRQGAFFLDVRSQDEYNQFHVKGSTLIPLDQLPNRVNELPKDKEVVVVCLTGHRSLNGTAILQQAGFKQVFCLSGGLQAWMNENYPVEKGPP